MPKKPALISRPVTFMFRIESIISASALYAVILKRLASVLASDFIMVVREYL